MSFLMNKPTSRTVPNLLDELAYLQPEQPFVIDGEVKAVNTVKACFTGDHRIMEGVHFGKMQQKIKLMFEQPKASL